ncbi:putative secreted protein (Por secretion system target) [Chitinophaga dinghuensis]|uniref:Putative secreted protein (Por secretion system target) n=1 Tax=Chitinophaga dinghuensis TaxID=1539050 RepID=A0A327VWX2_9BACT|nr:LamG-like jellyroll fold domain-containing protein [Chitinophaga dinghuensis]RAJ79334.1 putative secreted protein (Por secretion system target) [Chitinophaga dinghuensis]
MKKCYALLLALSCIQPAISQTKKVLLIGIDGCRHDAVLAANAPTLDSLLSNSISSVDALTETPTWSGVGWSAMLTGVWRNKTGVIDNTFSGSDYSVYKSFLERAELTTAARRTVSIVHWTPLNTYIIKNIDATINLTTDLDVKNAAVTELTSNNPDVLYVDFDDVDHAGHSYGFSPTVSQYTNAIATTDTYIRNILTALKSRPNYANEDWLVAVSTDHGGNMAGHGGSSFEERNIFTIFSNPHFTPTTISKSIVQFNMGGNYLSFTNGAYVKSPAAIYNFGTATDFTIECRVKLKAGFSGDPVIISNKNWANGKNKGFVLSAINGNSWKFNLGDGTNRVDMNGNIIADGKWHHLAIVCKRNGDVRMYEDGTLVGTQPLASIGDVNSNLPLAIGQDGTLTYGYHLDGNVAEVRIWNKATEESQLIAWMSQPVTTTHPGWSNLLSYWKGNDGSGSSWAELKGGNNGIITGTPLWQGPASAPAALNFAAAYAKPVTSSTYQFDTGNFTMECKVKIASWSGDPAILADKNWANGKNKGYILAATSSGGWKVNIGDGTNRADVNGGTIADNAWHHIAFTVTRGGNLITYQDGVQVSSASLSGVTGSIASGLPFAIGQDGTLTYSYKFPGNISDVRIWNKALSAATVNTWKDSAITASHPDYSMLSGYWPAHEGNGTTLYATGPVVNNATVYGTAAWQTAPPDTSFTYGVFNNTPRQVDMAVTCLDFLGIPIDTAWHLDGKSWIPATTAFMQAKSAGVTEASLIITPNPVHTHLQMQLSSPNDHPAIVSIYNLHHQVVKSYKIQPRKGVQQLQLDLPQLPTGMYLLEVQGTGYRQTAKVMVVQ